MNSVKPLTAILAATALLAGLTACQKKEVTAEEKGPAERVGAQIDQAATKAGEQLSKAAEQAGKELQAAGEKLKNAAQDAQKEE